MAELLCTVYYPPITCEDGLPRDKWCDRCLSRNPAPILCPECLQGKCRNCDGRAWDFEKDKRAPCECKDEAHA